MYRLEGLDEGWVRAGTRRVTVCTHVPPGEYVFRVKGSNNDGVWNDEGAAVRLSITPPFWGTWYFRGMSAFVVLAGLTVFYRRRLRRWQRERQMQQQFSLKVMESQENERKRIAGELHDSLGQDLLVIRNRALLGLRDSALSAHARDQLNQISAVAAQAISGVREIAHDLRPYQLDRLGLTKAVT